MKQLPTTWPTSLTAAAREEVQPGSAPRFVRVPPVQVNAWLPLVPTTSPLEVMPTTLVDPPSVPRSWIVPSGSHVTAWLSPVDVVLSPAICPLSLIAVASLVGPPRVPRSLISLPTVVTKACPGSMSEPLDPTILPLSLTAKAAEYHP